MPLHGSWRRGLLFIWICFLARGAFYCAFMPLWEGYDEWAHFAYIERLVSSGNVLVDRDEFVSREVQNSFQLAPIPWELRRMPGASLTQDDYWRLSPEARSARQAQIAQLSISGSGEPDAPRPRIYEALQPPLYYWLLSVPYRFLMGESLLERVYLLRFVSLLIASASVPLVFLAAKRVLKAGMLALGTCAVLTSLPELMIDVCRVGNECLGIVFFSWLLILSLDLASEAASLRTGVLAGIALGLGLITKAYFLTAVPALAAVYLFGIIRSQSKFPLIYRSLVTFGVAGLLSGWWYIHNLITTGTLSGLSESVMLRHSGWRHLLQGASHVQWRGAIDSILVSHVWFGGWSSLGARSWIYHFFFFLAAFGVVGVGWTWIKSGAPCRSRLYPLFAIYGFFWFGQIYNVLLLFLSKGVSTSMGWYLYAVIAAEIILLVVGLRTLAPMRFQPWIIPALILCFVALDLYTVHFVSIPYYTGLIAHRMNGSIASFHFADLSRMGIGELLQRLSVNKPRWIQPVTLTIAWLSYIFATLSLVALPFWEKVLPLPARER